MKKQEAAELDTRYATQQTLSWMKYRGNLSSFTGKQAGFPAVCDIYYSEKSGAKRDGQGRHLRKFSRPLWANEMHSHVGGVF